MSGPTSTSPSQAAVYAAVVATNHTEQHRSRLHPASDPIGDELTALWHDLGEALGPAGEWTIRCVDVVERITRLTVAFAAVTPWELVHPRVLALDVYDAILTACGAPHTVPTPDQLAGLLDDALAATSPPFLALKATCEPGGGVEVWARLEGDATGGDLSVDRLDLPCQWDPRHRHVYDVVARSPRPGKVT